MPWWFQSDSCAMNQLIPVALTASHLVTFVGQVHGALQILLAVGVVSRLLGLLQLGFFQGLVLQQPSNARRLLSL